MKTIKEIKEERERILSDIVHYKNTYFDLKDIEEQNKALRAMFSDKENTVIVKPRCSGVSKLLVVRVAHELQTNPNAAIFYMTKGRQNAERFLEDVKKELQRMVDDNEFPATKILTWEDRVSKYSETVVRSVFMDPRTSLETIMGSRLLVGYTSGDTRGMSEDGEFTMLVIDEMVLIEEETIKELTEKVARGRYFMETQRQSKPNVPWYMKIISSVKHFFGYKQSEETPKQEKLKFKNIFASSYSLQPNKSFTDTVETAQMPKNSNNWEYIKMDWRETPFLHGVNVSHPLYTQKPEEFKNKIINNHGKKYFERYYECKYFDPVKKE